MSLKPWARLLVTTCCIAQSTAASDVDSRGRDLIKQAEDKMDIFALPSFRKDANVRIDNFGKPLDGTYLLHWNGPDQWREEITFRGYSEVEVGSKGTVYVKRSAPILPYLIFRVRETLGFGATMGKSFLNLGPYANEAVKKLHEKRINGAKATCVEITTEMKYVRNVCLDQSTGTIRRDQESFVDSDLQPVGPKLFPRFLSSLESGERVAEVHITKLESPASFNTSVFQPPSGASAKAGCMNPTPATKIKDVVPRYPEEDKLRRNQGNVGVYTVIDAAGIPQNLAVALSASPGMNAASIESIRQWRYRPATCNGNPVETETIVEIHYTTTG